MPPLSSNFADGKQLVLDATDIVRLVGETVQLKRAGRRYVGLCPFHNEKSPSFSVDPVKRFFYCFGCKKGGNAIDFVMARDRSEFKDALETLAEWAGVELPRFERQPEQADKRKRLLEAHSAAAELYAGLLRDDIVGKSASEYLASRGFDAATIKTFGLGFAPAEWDNLARHGLFKKFPAPLLEEAGLLKRRERGDGFYDTFRDRVIFPIRDEQGRPIAFGGRVLPGGDSPAKYLNSPETPLFSKGRVLFGLDLAKRRIVETRIAVVFEGYVDAAMAHQYGVTNSVAVLGTALTPDHAATLRRLADKIVLLFDADAAGGMAARRSVELFLREPVEIAVAELPDGVDPDEFLQAHGAEAFGAIIAGAVDALEFQWRALRRSHKADASVTGLQKATTAYLNVLSDARQSGGDGSVDPMRWGAVLARVSKLLGLRAEELNRHFNESGGKAVRPRTALPPRPRADRARRGNSRWRQEPQYDGARRSDIGAAPVDSAATRSEALLLGAMFADPHLWHGVQEHVSPEAFTDRRYRWLAERFWEQVRNEGEPSFADWLEVLGHITQGKADAAARAKALCIELTEAAENLGEPQAVAADCVRFFQRRARAENLQQSPAPATSDDLAAEKAWLKAREQAARDRGQAAG